MAFQRSSIMTLNLIFMLCFVAIINNHVTLTNARQLKNSSSDDNNKEITSNESGENQAYPNKNTNNTNEENEVIVSEKSVGRDEAEDPNKNKKNYKAKNIGKGLNDEKQMFPFPFPFPFPWSMQPPLGGLPFPSPFDMIPPFTFPPFSFPPLDIPGIVPSPPA